MDYTFKELRCPSCKSPMYGAGGQFGGRINSVNMKCSSCDIVLLIFPMEKKYEYIINATTEEERKEKRIKEIVDESNAELEKRIQEIRNQKH